MDDGGTEFVREREVEFKSGASTQTFGTQGTLVEALNCVKEDVKLEISVARGGEGTVGTMELEQERRHALVGSGERTLFID